MASERMVGKVCDTDREVDLASCLLVLEVMHHPDPYSHSGVELSMAFVLVDAISVHDVWDAMLVFYRCPELLVDLRAMDGFDPSHDVARILYTDEAATYLSTMFNYDLLEDAIGEGFIRTEAWQAYSANRLSPEPLNHAGIRSHIATILGLPVLDRYLEATERPFQDAVDDSYLALVDVVSRIGAADAHATPSKVDPPMEMAVVEPVDDGHPAMGEVETGSATDEASPLSDWNGFAAQTPETSSDDGPKEVDCGASSVPPPRTMLVASPPASGRRLFPATAKLLEAPLPLHGFDGEDASQVMASLDRLRASVPWMSNVVDVVEEEVMFAWASGSGWSRIHPLLLSGPSGSGKTRFARMLADALGLRFSGMSFAGSTDNRSFEGNSVGWTNAKASWPSLTIADLRSANPLLLIDEVEKIDSTYNGDPRRTLVTMLDPEANQGYIDVGLDCRVDLSAVSWVLCCNEHRQLDVAFRDRLRVVEVVSPSAEHLPLIVDQAMRDIGSRMGVDVDRLPDMGDLMLSKAAAVFRTSKSMRSVVRCVDDAVRHRVVADARRGIRLPPPPQSVASVVQPLTEATDGPLPES